MPTSTTLSWLPSSCVAGRRELWALRGLPVAAALMVALTFARGPLEEAAAAAGMLLPLLPIGLGLLSRAWRDPLRRVLHPRGLALGVAAAQGTVASALLAALLLGHQVPMVSRDTPAAAPLLVVVGLLAGNAVAFLLRRPVGRPRLVPPVPRTGVRAPLRMQTLRGALAPALLAMAVATAGKLWALGAAAGLALADAAAIAAAELGFWLAWAVGLALLLHLTGPRLRRPLLGVAAGAAGLLVVLALLDAGYVAATGARCDVRLLGWALEHADDYAPIFASEVTAGRALLLLGAMALPLVGWWSLRRPDARRAGRLLGGTALAGLAAGGAALLLPLPPLGLGPPIAGWLAGASVKDIDVGPLDPPTITPADVAPRSLLPRAGAAHPNLVLVFLESTRADATSLFPPHRATTPNLLRLAREGRSVARLRALIPHTTKALTTTLCGEAGSPEIGVDEALDGALAGRCLPALLAAQGYRTASLRNAPPTFERATRVARNLGFSTVFTADDLLARGATKVGYFGVSDHELVGPGVEWSAADPTRPFFATYLSVGSHHPYSPIPGQVEVDYGTGDPALEAYLNAVREVDQFLGALVDAYAAAGLVERTVFVVLGDHGEAFGEHGLRAHDQIVYEEGLHVPAVFWGGPIAAAAEPIDGDRLQTDLLPTLLDLLGFDLVGPPPEGRSLWQPAPARTQHFSCWSGEQCGALITADGTKFIDGRGAQRDAWFHLRSDPTELWPFDASTAARIEAKRAIRTWQAQASARVRAGAAADERQRITSASQEPARGAVGPGLDLVDCTPTADAAPTSVRLLRCRFRTTAPLVLPLDVAWSVSQGAGHTVAFDALAGEVVPTERELTTVLEIHGAGPCDPVRLGPAGLAVGVDRCPPD